MSEEEKFTLEELLNTLDWNRKMLPKEEYFNISRTFGIEQVYIDMLGLPGYKIKPEEYNKIYNFVLALNDKVCELQNEDELE
jgi:hypothetical protein